MDQAVQSGSKIKVKTKSGENFKFKKIDVENGNYYGVKKINRKIVKIPLYEDNIERIQPKNKTLSTIINIGVPVIIISISVLVWWVEGWRKLGNAFDNNNK